MTIEANGANRPMPEDVLEPIVVNFQWTPRIFWRLAGGTSGMSAAAERVPKLIQVS